MSRSYIVCLFVLLLFRHSHAWDGGPKHCKHRNCNGGIENYAFPETLPEYGRSVSLGRVADCKDDSYTNNGLTCGRASHDYINPSRVADCPSGYTNTGLTCYRGPHSYLKCCTTIWSKCRCRSGYTNMGCHCQRWAKTRSSGHMSCPSGYFLNKELGRCYRHCKSGYNNAGEYCHRPASTKGINFMTCKGSNEVRRGARCYPKT